MGHEYGIMGMAGVGFFGMLLIGFLAGWIAEKTMNRNHGVLTNILVGIAGSFVGGTAASLLGFRWYGFIGNLVIAVLGAIAILWFFGKREHPAISRGDSANRGDHRARYDERGRESEASAQPEDTGSDLPPIYHAGSEAPEPEPAPAPKPKTSAKPAVKKTAGRKSPAKRKK